MQHALRASLVAVVIALTATPVLAQTTQPEAKASEAGKTTDSVKPKVTLDKIKLPPGGVVVVVDEIKEALALLPKMILMAPEEYQKLLDRLAFLEKQLKADKKLAHACKLAGRLEGGFVLLRAEFAFTTEQPWTTVILGLQGAHLTDEGDMDGQPPTLDVGDEGFSVKVPKEGTHRLMLNLKVPVAFKRPVASAGRSERGFDLGMPGAAVTTLALDLPAGVKEVRWNDNVEKPVQANHWELALGKIKGLTVSWKDQISLPGGSPLLTADCQIVVKLESDFALVNAEITLQDLRGQAKEWQVLLPQRAKVEVKAPAGQGVELLHPDANRPVHVVRLGEPRGDRLVVNVEVRYPRPWPTPRLAVGPFLVHGAYRQEGTITVQAQPDTLRGQRLQFHRFGDIFPRDLPKGPAGADVAALFKFWNVPGATAAVQGPAAGVPLELELKPEKTSGEASVDHLVQIRPGERGWFVEVTTLLQMKSKGDFVDLQLPRLRVPRSGLLGIAANAAFPATLPWQPLAPASGVNTAQAVPLGFACEEDGLKLGPPDAVRKARLTWSRVVGNEMRITGKYSVPPGITQVHVDLPWPVGIFDRGGKVRIKVPEQLELLVGAAGLQGPAWDKHELLLQAETFFQGVDIAWKPYRPAFSVTGLTDIRLHERSAEVKHRLDFIVPGGAVRAGTPPSAQLRLRVPAAIRDVTVVSGGKLLLHDPLQEAAWIVPSAEPLTTAEIVLSYNFAVPRKKGPTRPAPLPVPLIWPEGATRHEAKVRIWSETGVKPILADDIGEEAVWHDHGMEVVPGADVLPALVVQASGLELPLTVRLVEPAHTRPAALVCDRGLVQVTIDEEGTHTYRARYLISKLSARHLDIELPMPAANCLLNVWLDKQKIDNWEPLEPVPNIVQVPIQPRLYHQPVVLEIDYKLPASFTDGNRLWRTKLCPPQFRAEAFLGLVRWQVSLPYSWVGMVAGDMDYRWGLQGWLLVPEPSMTSADLESWLTKQEPTDAPSPVNLAFSRTGQDSVQLWHVSRQLWLLLCSGSLLALGLALYVLPWSRTVLGLLAVALGGGVLTAALLWPGWVPAVAFGCEPGALVLVVLIGFQWMLQESYRRRLVFMPGFTRLKSNSSLIRAGGSGTRREPSTIDAPAPAGSSVTPASPSSTKGS